MNNRPRFGFIVEYVENVDAAKAFYVDVLGLTIDREFPTFIQFKDGAGVAHAITSDPPLGSGEPETYWLVDDADAALLELSAKAEVVHPLQEEPYGKFFGLRGPAGNTQYLLALSWDRPSTPVS